MPITRQTYGTMPGGRSAALFTLTRGRLTATITDYGAHLVSLVAPDRAGHAADVTLGYDTLAGWLSDAAYLGATVGRVGNRIAAGRFTLNGKPHELARNDHGINHLHGGVEGFDRKLWHAAPFDTDRAVGVKFALTSPDGDENYPGTLTAAVTYALTDRDELVIDFAATTDSTTIVNLVHHTYWNLAGCDAPDVLDHELRIDAEEYLPVDEGAIPTGDRAPVAGTPMDFRKPKSIGRDIAHMTGEPGGFDHNWCLNGYDQARPVVRQVAQVHHPKSGRTMTLATDQPGVQFYSGNFLNGAVAGKAGVRYAKHAGLCLETQHYPDTPNHPDFPPITLQPGQTYAHRMIHTFTAR